MGKLTEAETDELFTLLKQAKESNPDKSFVQILYMIRRDLFPSADSGRWVFTDHEALAYLRSYSKKSKV